MVINPNRFCRFGKLKNQTIMKSYEDYEVDLNGTFYLVDFDADIEDFSSCPGDRDTPPCMSGDIMVYIHKVVICDNDDNEIEVVAGAPIYDELAEVIADKLDFSDLCEWIFG